MMNNAMTMDYETGHGIDYYAMAPEDGAEAEEKVLPLEKDESENYVYYDMTENHKLVKMIGKCPE